MPITKVVYSVIADDHDRPAPFETVQKFYEGSGKVERCIAFKVGRDKDELRLNVQLVPGTPIERINDGLYVVKDGTFAGQQSIIQVFREGNRVVPGTYKGVAQHVRRSRSGLGSEE